MSKIKCLFLAATMVLLADQSLRAQVCGSTNIALTNTTASASTSINATAPASLIDGNIATIWQPTQSGEQHATLDLGSVKNVCEIIIKWGRWNVPSAFQIQITESLTSPNWVTVVDVTSNNNFETEGFDYAFNKLSIPANGNVGRGVRLKMNIPNGSNWFVYEIEVREGVGSNSVPGVALTFPTAATTIAANTPMTLTATALDTDGTVTEVSFLANNAVIGNAVQTESPYSYTWIPTTAGSYTIKARAKDNNGAYGNSGEVTVTVTAASPGWGLLGNAIATNTSAFLGSTDNQPLVVKTNNMERLRVTADGKLVIGTTGFPAGVPANALLGVEGFIVAKGLKVTQNNWPDYVFEKNYKLMPLAELATFIKKNKHLPGVPSVKEVEKNGLNVGDNQAVLLKKIEELTLYMLEQDRRLREQEERNRHLEIELNKIKQHKSQ